MCTFLTFFSCVERINTSEVCGEVVRINNADYIATSTGNYTVEAVRIEGNCLFITIGSSGCDANWTATLVDANQIAISNPEQRYLKLALENNQLCEVYFTKEFSFDIANLQTTNSSISLNLEKWNRPITYNY